MPCRAVNCISTGLGSFKNRHSAYVVPVNDTVDDSFVDSQLHECQLARLQAKQLRDQPLFGVNYTRAYRWAHQREIDCIV